MTLTIERGIPNLISFALIVGFILTLCLQKIVHSLIYSKWVAPYFLKLINVLRKPLRKEPKEELDGVSTVREVVMACVYSVGFASMVYFELKP